MGWKILIIITRTRECVFLFFGFFLVIKFWRASRVYQVIQFSSLLFVRTQQIPICNTIFLIRKICHADARARTHTISYHCLSLLSLRRLNATWFGGELITDFVLIFILFSQFFLWKHKHREIKKNRWANISSAFVHRLWASVRVVGSTFVS